MKRESETATFSEEFLESEEINEDTAKAMVASLLDGLSSKLHLLSERLDEHERKMKQLRGA